MNRTFKTGNSLQFIENSKKNAKVSLLTFFHTYKDFCAVQKLTICNAKIINAVLTANYGSERPYCGAYLIRTHRITSPWWLQISWCQWPSATTMLTWFCLYSEFTSGFLGPGSSDKQRLTHWGRDTMAAIQFRRRHFQINFLEWKCMNFD